MTDSAIELYLYMGSHNEVIKWLKSEGVKTREQAINRLRPYVKGIAVQAIMLKGSLAGLSSGAGRILEAFPEIKAKKKLIKKHTK